MSQSSSKYPAESVIQIHIIHIPLYDRFNNEHEHFLRSIGNYS
jgi:hypothetical protein